MKRGPLLDAIERFLHEREAGGGWVVAVSGGADSVALLRALAELRVGPLVVAHLNHRLRAEESDADEDFVCRLCESLRISGLQLRRERSEVRGLAAGQNLEAFARQYRYDWLRRTARETGCPWVATGHTADDQAETVLHRLLRGAGLQGLRGIAPARPLDAGVTVVRPLLNVTRGDVLAYLDARGQDYCRDSSNADVSFTRNRIRHELLPHLAERYNPAVASVLARLAAQAREAFSEIEELAEALRQQAELPRAGSMLVFDHRVLAEAPPCRVREMFRLVWRREGFPRGDFTAADWDRLAALVRGELPAMDLPGGVSARRRERVVQIEPTR